MIATGVIVGCGDDAIIPLQRPDRAQGTDGGHPHDASEPVHEPMDVGSTSDAGAADAGAHHPDAGSATDGGTADGGTIDSGPADAGLDVPLSENFPLGVASGDVTNSDAMLWTRYQGPNSLLLVVEDETGQQTHRHTISTNAAGYVHNDIGALVPGSRYSYHFVELDGGVAVGRSPRGRFRAAIDVMAQERLRFGACSCTNNRYAMTVMEQAGRRSDLDAFFLLGDTTYNDGARSEAEYRALWTQNLGTPGYRALRGSTSLLSTWDDHEVTNNWNPEMISPQHLEAATAAMFENLPLRRHGSSPDRLYKKVRWGQTAEIFVLDCRGERRPSTRGQSGSEYISKAQMAWLKEGLRTSPAAFKLILNSVPIADLPVIFDAELPDRWDGYPEQRLEILSFIDDEGIDGVVWLGGDFHLAYRGRVASSGPGSSQIEILAGPGAQVPTPLAGVLRQSPQFDWAIARNNYLVLELDPTAMTVRAIHHGIDDSVLGDGTYDL